MDIKGLKLPEYSILAIDPAGEPNGTTGYAILHKGDIITTTTHRPKEKPYEEYAIEFIKNLEELHKKYNFKDIIIENFILYPQSSGRYFYSPIWTSELIGIVNAFCITHSIKLTRRPTPGIKKTGENWDRVFDTPHERDAYTHLILWILKGNEPKKPLKVVKKRIPKEHTSIMVFATI